MLKKYLKQIIIIDFVVLILLMGIYTLLNKPNSKQTYGVFIASSIVDQEFFKSNIDDSITLNHSDIKQVNFFTISTIDKYYEYQLQTNGMLSCSLLIIDVKDLSNAQIKNSFYGLDNISIDEKYLYKVDGTIYGIIVHSDTINLLDKYVTFDDSSTYVMFINNSSSAKHQALSEVVVKNIIKNAK